MIDVLLLLMVVGAGVLGWRRGLAVSLVAGIAFVLAGLPFAALAAAIGAPPAMLAFVVGGMLGLVPLALRLPAVEAWMDDVLTSDAVRIANRVAGMALNAFVAIAIGWFAAALAMIAPGDSAGLGAMRSSAVFGTLVEAVPPQGPFGAVVLRSGLVPALNGPLVLAEEPDPGSAATPAVLAARASVLQVRSTACDRIVTGTGWVAGDGMVVTNAHVVAGTRTSFLAGGPQYEGVAATVTAFDPVNDLAVLVLDPGQQATLPKPLPIAQRVQHGEPAAVIGFPKGGRQRADAARIDRVASFDVEPVGGGPLMPADVLAFRGAVEPGNSGGPVVSEAGEVLGVVVAKAIGQRVEAAYGAPSSAIAVVMATGAARQRVATGTCLTEDDLTTVG